MIQSSPYSKAYLLKYEDGEASLERNSNQATKLSSSDKIHTVKDGDTIFSIANQYYRDSGKWYIIADANYIINPFREVTPGIKLIIPNNGF